MDARKTSNVLAWMDANIVCLFSRLVGYLFFVFFWGGGVVLCSEFLVFGFLFFLADIVIFSVLQKVHFLLDSYKAEQRRLQQNVLYRSVVPPLAPHLRKNVVDDGVDPAAVFFCWQVYDIYKRKLWKSAKSNRFVQNRDADNG